MFNIDFGEIFFRIKIFSGIISFLSFSLGVFFIVQFQKLVQIKSDVARSSLRFKDSVSGGGALISKWGEVERHIDSPRESEWKLAIIEADKLIDNLLRSAGYPGDTMGERLMNIEQGQLLTLQGLWEAHKIRNKLVHDVNYFLRYAEARKVIELYKDTLRELSGIQ